LTAFQPDFYALSRRDVLMAVQAHSGEIQNQHAPSLTTACHPVCSGDELPSAGHGKDLVLKWYGQNNTAHRPTEIMPVVDMVYWIMMTELE